MKVQLEAHEATNQELDNSVRYVSTSPVLQNLSDPSEYSPLRRHVQSLEIQLAQARKRTELKRRDSEQDMISVLTGEKRGLLVQNEDLREENAELRDLLDEVTAMRDILRAKIEGSQGLTSERPESPLIPTAM
jgi:hypothetical protein